MRVVIELKRDAYPQVVLNNLYKQTPLQSNFGANMLALVDGEPQTLTLREFLKVFLDFRVETIERRTRFELEKAEARDHVLQGYLIAMENLDAVIATIRHAADTPAAKAELIETYGLSEVQADAILQMQLRRLTALETDKIETEHQALQEKIADLRDILARRDRVLTIVKEEIAALKERHATPRRTVIERNSGDLDDIDLIANERSTLVITEQGYIKRMPVSHFETQNRATRGKSGAKMKENDEIQHFLTCCDHDTVLFFSERGVVYSMRAYQIPESSRVARGTPLVQLLPIGHDEKITSIQGVSEFTDDNYLVMLTQGGYIKKTALSAFANIRANGLIAISLNEGDELCWVRLAQETDSILIGSRSGMAIHFRADRTQLRPLGRTARGVKSMNLKAGDELVGIDILPAAIADAVASSGEDEGDDDELLTDVSEDTEDGAELSSDEGTDEGGTEDTGEEDGEPRILVVTSQGYGKRIPVEQFKLYNRATKGKIATKFKSGQAEDCLAGILVVHDSDEIMLVTSRGIIIRQAVDAIPVQSRGATGVRLQRLDKSDAIAAVAVVPPEEKEVLDELEADGEGDGTEEE